MRQQSEPDPVEAPRAVHQPVGDRPPPRGADPGGRRGAPPHSPPPPRLRALLAAGIVPRTHQRHPGQRAPHRTQPVATASASPRRQPARPGHLSGSAATASTPAMASRSARSRASASMASGTERLLGGDPLHHGERVEPPKGAGSARRPTTPPRPAATARTPADGARHGRARATHRATPPQSSTRRRPGGPPVRGLDGARLSIRSHRTPNRAARRLGRAAPPRHQGARPGRPPPPSHPPPPAPAGPHRSGRLPTRASASARCRSGWAAGPDPPPDGPSRGGHRPGGRGPPGRGRHRGRPPPRSGRRYCRWNSASIRRLCRHWQVRSRRRTSTSRAVTA